MFSVKFVLFLDNLNETTRSLEGTRQSGVNL